MTGNEETYVIHWVHERQKIGHFSYLAHGLKQTSTYKQLHVHVVLSKLIAACSTHVEYSRYSLTIVPHPQLLRERPKKCQNENMKHLGDSFGAVADQSYM